MIKADVDVKKALDDLIDDKYVTVTNWRSLSRAVRMKMC